MASTLHADDLEVGFWSRVLRRRAPTIVLFVLGAIGAAMIAMAVWPTRYTATSEVLLREPLLSDTTVASAPETDVASELVFLKSRYVVDQVSHRLGFPAQVSAEADPGSRVIVISARAGEPARAARTSSTYASTYAQLRAQVDERERRDAAASLQRSIDDVDRMLAARGLSAEDRDRLEAQRAAYVSAVDSVLVRAQLAAHETVSVLSLATTASADRQPSTPLMLIVAGLAGLFVGVLVGGVREQLDDRIHDGSDLHAAVDVPLLATVPAVYHRRGWRRTALADPGSPTVDAIALVRARVQELAIDKPSRIVAVTGVGPVAELEAAAVAVNLAASCARIGQRTVLVMADLRTRKRIGFPVDLRAQPGLATVATGAATLAQSLRPVTELPGLTVLPSGAVPASVPDVLTASVLSRVLDEVSSDAEVVVVLTAPSPGWPDAGLVAESVDGTVLVAVAPRRGPLARAVSSLAAMRAHVVGVVLVTSDRRARTA